MKRELGAGGKWLAAATVTGIILYLVTTAAAGGRHPRWPYVLLGALTVIGLGLYLYFRVPAETSGAMEEGSHSASQAPDLSPSGQTSAAPRKPSRITIANDGNLVGGDSVSVDLVTDLLEIPAAERKVEVTAEALQDVNYKRSHPDKYLRLCDAVNRYEKSINTMMQGRVHYYWKWQVKDLSEAVLELRRLALPAVTPGEDWYTWPAAQPEAALNVWLRPEDVKSVHTVYYLAKNSGDKREESQNSPNEPIWLREIMPRIVWTRVAPTVIFHIVKDNPEAPVMSLDDWVLSDRHPSQMPKTAPSRIAEGLSPPSWKW